MSDDTHDLLDEGSADRSQRLIDRMEGLIRHQEDILGQVRDGRIRPYCHIPDLFDLDTEAVRPYSVPSSFIPEQVGGNVSVKSTRGAYLDHEPLDLVLGSFLPGGYKRRYRFDMWTGNWDDGSEPGFADIQPGVSIRRKASLADVLPDTDHEEYTPYRHATDAVTVYIPNQFTLQNPSVSDEVDFQRYYWDEEAGLVRNFLPEDVDSVDEAGYLPLASDPTSQFLWFKHLLYVRDQTDELALDDLNDGLFSTLTFSDDAIFLKSYYATLLTLYGENRTFSKVVRYRHEADDQIAFMGSREESQLLLFNLHRTRVQSLLAQEVTPGSKLYRDLQFAMLYRRIWNQFFFRDGVLGHAFSVDPFYQALVGVDYMLRTGSEGPDTLFACEPDDIVAALETLLPGPNQRFGLLDYDDSQIDRYFEICRENSPRLARILTDCADHAVVTAFAEHVLVHSIKHGIATWAVEFSAGGSDFEAWYDINFQQRADETVQIGIYDSIQGGAGISREVFDDLQTLPEEDFIHGLGSQGSCHISASEDIVLRLLAATDPMTLYDAFHAENVKEYQTLVDRAYASLSVDYRHNTLDDLRPMVRRRLRSILETPEVSRFYSEVANAYRGIEAELGRTPTTTDVVLAMEDRSIFDTRVKRTYDRFANRRSQRRDISELAERIEEVTKQCVRACPDCLKRQSCTHQYRYQTEMLDRRLLSRTFSHLEEET